MAGLRGKRIPGLFATFCMALMLVSCGGRETLPLPSPSGERPPFFAEGGTLDTVVDDDAFCDVAKDLPEGKFLSMQFHGGEPVQLWASGSVLDGGEAYVSVYLYRRDGRRETCLEKVGRALGMGVRYLDEDGCLYSVSGEGNISKLDGTGKTLYTASVGGMVTELCQVGDGRIAVLYLTGGKASSSRLALLDERGSVSPLTPDRQPGAFAHIGLSGGDLLLLDGDYIDQIDLGEGKRKQLYSFRQTAYTPKETASAKIRAFSVKENDGLEILWTDLKGAEGRCETIAFRELKKEKTAIVLRSVNTRDSWLKEQVVKFNSSDQPYYVVLQMPEEGEEEAFITRTGVELGTGKGADILQGTELLGKGDSLISKGILENLSPLIQSSGMKEADYFPAAFCYLRKDRDIYCVDYCMSASQKLLDEKVLAEDASDIEAVVEALLDYSEKAVYRTGYSADSVLRDLMEGSETLWGMVDWEARTCDFNGGLFARLLETAGRYGDDGGSGHPAVSGSRLAGVFGFGNFETLDEVRKKGFVVSGTLFDEGCHPEISSGKSVLAINANSANKEGAWRFVQFLLGEEAQETVLSGSRFMPVNRAAFYTAAEKEIAGWTEKSFAVFEGPLTRERVDEMAAFLEDARALPYRTVPILDIVLEEAADYFNGTRQPEQVIKVIENRVGLYLME